MSALTDADRARHWADVELSDRRAVACRASVESHGGDEILVGAICRVCGSPGEWGLYRQAETGVVHCRECMAIQEETDTATDTYGSQPFQDDSPGAGATPAVAA